MTNAIEYANEKIDLKISKIQSKIDQLNEKLNEPEDAIIRLTCEETEWDGLCNDMDESCDICDYDKTEDKSYVKDLMKLLQIIAEHKGTLHGYEGEYTKVGDEPLYGGEIYKGEFKQKELNDPENWTVDYFVDNYKIMDFELYECGESEYDYGMYINLKFFVDLPKSQYEAFVEKCNTELKHIPTPSVR